MLRVSWRAAQAPADLDAGRLRQHPIEQHQIGRPLIGGDHRFFAVHGDADLIAFLLKIVLEQFGQRRFVFDDQDVSGIGHVWFAPQLMPGSLSARGRSESISSPVTRKWMYSAILVPWSPMRSMFLAMKSKWAHELIVRGSSIM